MDPDTDTFTCPRCDDHDAHANEAKTCSWCTNIVCDNCWDDHAALCMSCYEATFVCEVCEGRFDDEDHRLCMNCECWVCDNDYVEGPELCTKCAANAGIEDHNHAAPYIPDEAVPVFPWERRGIFITVEHPKHPPAADHAYYPDWQASWPIDRTLDPITAAADFYLLELVCHPALHVGAGAASDPDLVVLAEMARLIRAEIVDTFDPVFCRYVDMVVGGELRHVSRVRAAGLIRSPRPVAWLDWHNIRSQLGVDALIDAAKMFGSMSSGSFGGTPWAQAAEILASRLRGRITPEQFVDRVFCLEHNCGSLLNKLTWGLEAEKAGANQDFFSDSMMGPNNVPVMKYPLVEAIKEEIGPAHAADPPILPVLLAHASKRAKRIFFDWYRAVNKVKVRMRATPMPPVTRFETIFEYRLAAQSLVASHIEPANPVFAEVMGYGPRWLYATEGEAHNWVTRYRKFVRYHALRPPDYAWLVEFTNLLGARGWDDSIDNRLLVAVNKACAAVELESHQFIEGRPSWAQPAQVARCAAALDALRAVIADGGVSQHLFAPPPRRMTYAPRKPRPTFAPDMVQPELEF